MMMTGNVDAVWNVEVTALREKEIPPPKTISRESLDLYDAVTICNGPPKIQPSNETARYPVIASSF